MSKSNDKSDEGLFRPDSLNLGSEDIRRQEKHCQPLHIDVTSVPHEHMQQQNGSSSSKRRTSSLSDCADDSDSQSSPPVNKKGRFHAGSTSAAVPREGGVIDSVKQALMASDVSVSEKQEQLSRMIAELQNLKQNLHTQSKVNNVVSLMYKTSFSINTILNQQVTKSNLPCFCWQLMESFPDLVALSMKSWLSPLVLLSCFPPPACNITWK